MGKRGVFSIKILISLLDGSKKNPMQIAKDWNDEKQHRHYSSYCKKLAKQGILDKKKVRKTFNEEMINVPREKEYNIYSLNLENYIKFVTVQNIERKANKKVSEEDIKLLKRYYKSKFFLELILPKLRRFPMPFITLPAIYHGKAPKGMKTIIKHMNEFNDKYFVSDEVKKIFKK